MNRGKFHISKSQTVKPMSLHFHCIKKKKKKEEGPLNTGRGSYYCILKDVEKRAQVWETSCETQSSPHTVLCTGVLQLTTEGRDFFFQIKSDKSVSGSRNEPHYLSTEAKSPNRYAIRDLLDMNYLKVPFIVVLFA